jgi:uncharacterized membrane protein YfcA
VLGGALGLVLGSLRLPAVILASGSAATAAGTNIAVSAASALTGGIAHARAGRVDWRIAAWMTPPSVAAFLGGYFGGRVPETLLLGGIAAALLWNGVQLLFELGAASCPQPQARSRRRGCGHRPDRRCGRSHPRHASNAALLGRVGLPAARAVGTNLVVGFFLGLAGFAGHAVRLEVDWPVLAVSVAAAVPGAWLGARLTGRMYERTLKRAIGAALVAVGLAIAVEAAL